jgi:tetratricopeptide (TPR) repeat protein
MHERRAEAYYFEGEYDEALASYDEAIQLNPVSANVLHYRTLELAAAYEEEFRAPAQAFVYAQKLN